MSKHTPGPWTAPEASGLITGYIWAHEPYGGIVAQVEDGGQVPYDQEQRKANAHLIAAAPELLEALKSLVEDCSPEVASKPGSWLRQAFLAIRKAEGDTE